MARSATQPADQPDFTRLEISFRAGSPVIRRPVKRKKMKELTTILFSSLVGALVAYLGAILKNKIDTRTRFDDSLFEKRTEAYSKLWETTKAVPKWPKSKGIKNKELEDYSKNPNSWYYEIGGIFMSRSAQRAYAALQETIWEVIAKDLEQEIDEATYQNVYTASSTLRTELTNDLLSRRSAPSV
ncbi:MAG: hypothetical protein KDI73_10055 [Candidatus Competibacteraceae bacterium]|nr:hypothetical protein [Candidatus Competibacteraceae bacterium]